MLTADADFEKKKFGLGGVAFKDQNDIISQTGFQMAYSYNVKLGDNLNLGMGLNAGLVQWTLDFENLKVQDPSEDILNTARNNASTFRSDFGFRLSSKNFDLGFAVPQFVTSKVNYTNYLKNTNTRFTQNPHYLVNMSYRIQLVEDVWNFKPMVLLRGASGIDPQVDMIGVLDWKKRAYASVGYRTNFAMTLGGGVNMNNGMTLGYNFDRPVNDIKSFTAGSHEIVLGFTLGKSKGGEVTYKMSKEDREVIEAMKKSDAEKSKKLEELEKKLEQFEEKNRTQQKDIERFKKLMEQNDAELEKLKKKQKEILDKAKDDKNNKEPEGVANTSESPSKFIIVLSSFKLMQDAQEYQNILARSGEASKSKIMKDPDGDWFFVYEESFGKKDAAQKRLNQISKTRTETPKIPWIFVGKE